MKYIRGHRGFTLVEMAVVLVIVGLLLGSFIGTVSSRIEATRYVETKNDLEDIKRAIIGYAYRNTILPCPDTDGDGVSEVTCAIVNTGFVPWVTLGLGGSDPWDNRYEYRVDVNFSTAFDLDTILISGGRIQTLNAAGNALIPLANNAAVVIFSRGKNGLGATGVNGALRAAVPVAGHDDEIENGNNDQTYVSRSVSSVTDVASFVGVFDDVVVWLSEYELKAKMVEAGVLP